MNLQSWLRRKPQPHTVVCGEQRIAIGLGRRRWADAIAAIWSTTAPQIVAVDSKNCVLRVCERSDIDDAPETEEESEVTEQQKELAQIAQIVADAYSTAHEHARETSARGYELLARFAELSFSRLAAIERAYAQLLNAHAKAIDTETGGDGALDGAMAGVIGRAIAGGIGATKPDSGATNPDKGNGQ